MSDVCNECWGSGEIIVCPDDMCRSIGECVHGDGMRMCRACNGTGYGQGEYDDARATATAPDAGTGAK